MTAAIIPFPQDLTGKRRTDLSGPCVIMVLPAIRIERHPGGVCLSCGDFVFEGDDCANTACQIEKHGVVYVDEITMLSDDAFDACAFHFAMLRDCPREQQ